MTRDAWAIWDVERQDWVLDTLFDHVYCHQCLDHSRLDRVPLIVPAVRPPEGGV